jgi:hypothetical protein
MGSIRGDHQKAAFEVTSCPPLKPNFRIPCSGLKPSLLMTLSDKQESIPRGVLPRSGRARFLSRFVYPPMLHSRHGWSFKHKHNRNCSLRDSKEDRSTRRTTNSYKTTPNRNNTENRGLGPENNKRGNNPKTGARSVPVDRPSWGRPLAPSLCDHRPSSGTNRHHKTYCSKRNRRLYCSLSPFLRIAVSIRPSPF